MSRDWRCLNCRRLLARRAPSRHDHLGILGLLRPSHRRPGLRVRDTSSRLAILYVGDPDRSRPRPHPPLPAARNKLSHDPIPTRTTSREARSSKPVHIPLRSRDRPVPYLLPHRGP